MTQYPTSWLSAEELANLTGRRQHAAQARALSRMGVPFKVRPDGSLVVGRAALEQALGAKAKAAEVLPNGLNWSR